jgi:hypothetical protein
MTRASDRPLGGSGREKRDKMGKCKSPSCMGVIVMNIDRQEEMREALIRRALEEVSFKEKQKEESLCIRDTLAALEEITTLTREELETLANEVKRSCEEKGDEFFSLKHQIVLAVAFVGFTSCLSLLGMWLF